MPLLPLRHKATVHRTEATPCTISAALPASPYCLPAASSPQPRPPKTSSAPVSWRFPSVTATLTARSAYFSTYTWSPVFETLTTFLEDGTLVGELAASWRQVDPTAWEFTLRPDVVFSNGRSAHGPCGREFAGLCCDPLGANPHRLPVTSALSRRRMSSMIRRSLSARTSRRRFCRGS